MIKKKKAYALYRLPYSDTYTEIIQEEGSPETFFSSCELNGRNGFALAPFAVSEDLPILFILADRTVSGNVDDLPFLPDEDIPDVKCFCASYDSYASDFEVFHSKLKSGAYSKLVLSRCAVYESLETISPRTLFARACRFFPRMFVALVHTEHSGTWLAATPEVLLDSCGKLWHTIALAGTMPLEECQEGFDNPPVPYCYGVSTGGIGEKMSGDSGADGILWSVKNIDEQRYVSSYIKECVLRFTDDCREEGPYTARAGNVVHLRSDFTFTLPSCDDMGRLVDALHPTPAVCGVPKHEAFGFISSSETSPRGYYSGFMGPVGALGNTHLYVSLRCMRIDGRRYMLYAGGGLLPESNVESEWNETEAKMEAMRKCLAIKRI